MVLLEENTKRLVNRGVALVLGVGGAFNRIWRIWEVSGWGGIRKELVYLVKNGGYGKFWRNTGQDARGWPAPQLPAFSYWPGRFVKLLTRGAID